MRLCSTLVKYGFVGQDQEARQYFLGLRLFELGSIVLSSFWLRKAASPYLTQLQVKFGKAVFLGVLDEGDLLYIDKREDAEVGISFPSNIGRRRPPYWGMLGPALVGVLPDNVIERLLERSPLVKTAKKSFTASEDFKAWLRTIRERGFLVEDKTAIDGIGGIGAPVRDHTGNVVAAVGVGFISSSADSKTLKKMVKEVIATADAISKELGFRASPAWDVNADWSGRSGFRIGRRTWRNSVHECAFRMADRAAPLWTPLSSSSVRQSAHETDNEATRLRSLVSPCVARAGSARVSRRRKVHLSAVVEGHPDLPRYDVDEVDTLGGVHARNVRVHAGGHARQLLFHLLHRRLDVEDVGSGHSGGTVVTQNLKPPGGGKYVEKARGEPSSGKEGSIVATPQREEFRARRKGNGDGVHQGLAPPPRTYCPAHGPSLFSVSSSDSSFLLLSRMPEARRACPRFCERGPHRGTTVPFRRRPRD